MNIIFSHFYNEEYLLPWWLMHHTPLFDHGVLINRGSTDRSVEICRQFAPHWEVRNSKVAEFDALEVDREVMEIEAQYSGWKMVLNTTEYLCCWDKTQFFSSLNHFGSHMYFVRFIIMVDHPHAGYADPVYTLPLVKQRHHGYFPNTPFMGRYIHRYDHGNYTAGRHWTARDYQVYLHPAYVLRFVYSPWNDAMRKRKLQIGPTLSARAIQLGLGTHHLANPHELEQSYLQHVHLAADLRMFPEYQQLGLGL